MSCSCNGYCDHQDCSNHIATCSNSYSFTSISAGVVIVEGLNLTGVPEGDYELLCLPLKLKDADGAPARVLLRER